MKIAPRCFTRKPVVSSRSHPEVYKRFTLAFLATTKALRNPRGYGSRVAGLLLTSDSPHTNHSHEKSPMEPWDPKGLHGSILIVGASSKPVDVLHIYISRNSRRFHDQERFFHGLFTDFHAENFSCFQNLNRQVA